MENGNGVPARPVRARIAAVLLLALALGVPAAAAAQEVKAPAPADCVGLVLGGGGARGAAHVGVLKVLERERIPVCAVAGTSMGAIVGGLYAAGYDAPELERLLGAIDWADVLVDDPARRILPMERKDEDFRHLLNLEIGYRDGRLGIPAGLVRGQKLMLLLRRLTLSSWQAPDFDHLPIPFRAVATDILTGQKHVFADGDLAVAIRASMSVPGAFAPVEVGDRLLVDGGLAENVPVSEVRALGATRMIVVDVGSPLLGEDGLTSPAAVLNQAVTALMAEKTASDLATLGAGDVLVRPDLGDITSGQFNRAAEAVAAGERAAEAMLPQLRAFAVAPAQYAALRARQRHRDFDPGLVAFLDVEPGHSPSATRRVAWATEGLVGQRFDVDAVEKDIGRAYGDGRFETIDYRLVQRDGQAGLELVPQQKPWTAFGKVGLQLDDDFNGRSNYLLSAELVFSDVNRIGGQWRNLLQLGRTSGIRSEFHQPFGDGGAFYIEPALDLHSESLPLWEDGRVQVAEYRLLRRQFSLEAGYSPRPEWRVSLALMGGKDSVRRGIGDEQWPRRGSERFAGLRLGATWDTLDSVNFPTRGTRAEFELLSLQPWANAHADGEVVRASFDQVLSWRRYHVLLGAHVASAMDDQTAFRSQTFLGGFLNLSGFSERSLLGNQAALVRSVFYRRTGDTSRLFALPLYLGGSLEAGNVWSERNAFGTGTPIFAGSVFAGLDTPLGPVFLGFGRNSSGADSWYLSFGSMLRENPD
jgi:NTE family protein